MKAVKTYSPKTKILSLILSLLIVFYLVPTSVFAEGLDNDTTVSDSSASANEENSTYTPDIYEVTELREENVKHFRLEDGSYVAAQYNYPVHYTDENGQLADIDNRLIDSGSELSTNNSRVKFIKKITGNGNIFTLHENNTKITMGLVGAEKKTEGVVTSTNNSDNAIESVLGKMTNLEKISSTIIYKDILDGIDLEYVIHSLSIKENIIIKERKNNYSYTFNIELNNLTATLSTDGNVYISSYDGEMQYVIPAPTVFDANGVYAPQSISSYTLTTLGNGKYELVVTVKTAWMNEDIRAFPVVLDPSILGSLDNAIDLNIDSASPNTNTDDSEDFYVSTTERAYLKFNVSQFVDIPADAAIVKAELNATGGCGHNSVAKVGAYEITTNWDRSLTWNKTIAASAQGSFSNQILDYVLVDPSNSRHSWNITELYKRWLNGETNYGVGLRLVDETATTERAHFTSWNYCPLDDDTNYYGPVIMVSYVYNDGIEGYYPTTSHSAGAGGVGSINLSTGRLTLAIPTLTTTDSLFAFTPTLVYNSSLAGKANTKENVSSPFSASYMPHGNKLNIQETIVEKTYKDADGATRSYYLLYDADGTTHDFYSKTFVSPYYDADGLRLTLTRGTNEITITDINQNVKTYSRISGGWHLTKITDKYGNELIFEFNSSYQPITVYVKPNGLSNIEMLSFLYEDDKLCAVYNDFSKDSVVFRYLGNNLASVEYCYGNSNTTEQNVRDTYLSSPEAANVTVYATATYTYDSNGYITEITDSDTNKSIRYEITNGKITKLSEYAGEILGQQVSYSYSEGYTDVRSTGNDETLNTSDDIITRYIIDSYGRSVSVYSMSADGTEIYGATTGTYETAEKVKNSLKETAILGGVEPSDIIVNESSTDGHFATLQGGIDKTAETGCYKQTVFYEENVASLTSSNANKEYIISGFGYANSIIPNGTSNFSIGVNVYYYQGESVDDEIVTYRFSFADVENVRQYVCGKFNCNLESTETANYDYVRKIEVVCSYYGQVDIGFGAPCAYFDDIALTGFRTQSGYNYSYDSKNGNLVKKENSLYQEYYYYDEENRVERIENNYGEIYAYEYNEDIDTGESQIIELYSKLGDGGDEILVFVNVNIYNKYGLLTYSVQLDAESEDYSTDTSESERINTSYVYNTTSGSKIFGALVSETDSLGHTTTYTYDTSNGQLDRQINSSSNTGYYYFYDDEGKLILVTPYPAASNNELVGYGYSSSGYLDEITTQSTKYTLQYDDFGNATGVIAGNNTLATYEYYSNNGKLKKINYGNGFSEEYVYNTLEMLSEIWYTYDDGTEELAYSYTYNHDGTLSKLDNHLEGISTEYRYDGRGRLISIHKRNAGETSYKLVYRVGYDTENRIAGYSNVVSYASSTSEISREFVTSFVYNSKGQLSTVNLLGNNHNINYTYDNFGRISSVYGNLGAFQHTEQYTYVSDDNNNTSYLVDNYTSTVGNSPTTYNYTYDNKGNITKIVIGDKEIRYVYDDLDQLVREDNGQLNATYTYTYDNAGNIISKKTYTFIDEGVDPTSHNSIDNYIYDDTSWGDKLIFYNKHSITYDEIGNPLSYYNGSTYTFTWTGRQLTSAVKGSKTMSFTYNDEGIRTSKTVNGVVHTYQLNGSQIVSESWGDKLIVYLYDASGAPIGMMYRTTSYDITAWDVFWFEKNLQGDVVAIYNESGTKVATYTYKDAWGNHIVSYTNGGGSTGAQYNPFRYRGYYYDTDLGMYYLQSRYYDAKICRFINADSALYHSMLGYNMFAYCGNNPINYYDPTGENAIAIKSGWLLILALLDSATPILETIFVVGVVSLAVGAVLNAAQNKTPEKTKDKPNDSPSSVTEPNSTPELDDNGNPVVKPGQQPTEKEGYIPPKGGPVKGRTSDGKIGWKDKNGNIWVPAPTGYPEGHGGGHWDVQSPKGGYSNVYPGGMTRGGKAPYPIFP